MEHEDMSLSQYDHLDQKIDSLSLLVSSARVDISAVSAGLAAIAKSVEQLVLHTQTQNGRIRKLELWRSWVMGAAFFLGLTMKILYDVGSEALKSLFLK